MPPSSAQAVAPRSAQPNVPGRGIVASYTLQFWTLVLLVGVGAGLGGAALMELLRFVQHLAWSYRPGAPLEGETFLEAVDHSSAARRVAVVTLGGLVTGVGVVLLAGRSGAGEVSEELWLRDARLPLLTSVIRAAHSIVVVGLGASLGREAAPQRTGAAVASSLSLRAGLPDWQRRLLVACGAGAGMAAVYNVPLGGALFALEVLLGTLTLPLVLPALATTLTATAVAWIALPNHSTYVIPAYHVTTAAIVWAAIVGPIAGIAAVGYVRLIAAAHSLRIPRRLRVLVPLVVFAALGTVAIAYPEILGNGKNVVQLALLGRIAVATLAVLVVLKPLATASCLGSGAPGGLFTPTLAYGVLLGGLLGEGFSQLWPGTPVGGYALIGGAAVLAAAMQGPLAAIVLIIELAHNAESLIVPVLLAVVGATVMARRLGAPSIYSARLSAREPSAGFAAERMRERDTTRELQARDPQTSEPQAPEPR